MNNLLLNMNEYKLYCNGYYYYELIGYYLMNYILHLIMVVLIVLICNCNELFVYLFLVEMNYWLLYNV